MRARRILVMVLTLCALSVSVAALESGSSFDGEPPSSAVDESEQDSFLIFMSMFDEELAQYDELDSGPPLYEEYPPYEESASLADDVHMLRFYAEFVICILFPCFIVFLFCWWLYCVFVRPF